MGSETSTEVQMIVKLHRAMADKVAVRLLWELRRRVWTESGLYNTTCILLCNAEVHLMRPDRLADIERKWG